ncbi:MAG: hypothetical protein H7Z13_21040 [Ferruginibacter sp.]|nr:hypothetical protein [Ferruginibacter sp.]
MAKIILLYACPIPKSQAFFTGSAMNKIIHSFKTIQRLALNIKIRSFWRLQFFLVLLKVHIHRTFFVIRNLINNKNPLLCSWPNVVQMPDYLSVPTAGKAKGQVSCIAGMGSKLQQPVRKTYVRGKVISFND